LQGKRELILDLEAEKSTSLNELDFKKPLMVFISQRSISVIRS
jgi:hypothetical protein